MKGIPLIQLQKFLEACDEEVPVVYMEPDAVRDAKKYFGLAREDILLFLSAYSPSEFVLDKAIDLRWPDEPGPPTAWSYFFWIEATSAYIAFFWSLKRPPGCWKLKSFKPDDTFGKLLRAEGILPEPIGEI